MEERRKKKKAIYKIERNKKHKPHRHVKKSKRNRSIWNVKKEVDIIKMKEDNKTHGEKKWNKLKSKKMEMKK